MNHPPFIQIMGGDRTTVYGLTASGDVYQWLGYFGDRRWERLGNAVPPSETPSEKPA